jgi:hypothetical protein
MNTCGTCKYFGDTQELSYWDDEKDEFIVNNRFRACQLLKHLNGSDGEKVHAADIAGVKDGSGYHAVFCVSEEFGCNQWTAKDAESRDPNRGGE